MQLQPWWYRRAVAAEEPPLAGDAQCDCVVIGGGIAGLHAALCLAEAGQEVMLLERTSCGGGASGRSSGFLTPDSELELHTLIHRFGRDDAARLWRVALDGAALVVDTARRHGIACDVESQDSLFVGIGRPGAARVAQEGEARSSLGYACELYDARALREVHPGGYSAGIRYSGTATLDPFSYCQGLKRILLARGVRIHERTRVRRIDGTTVHLASGTVRARRVIACVTGVARDLAPGIAAKCYHAQTFLAMSEPLTPAQRQALFPADAMQCWDSRMVYTYYRLTPDERLLLGGGLALTTFAPSEVHSPFVIQRVIDRFLARFPALRSVVFTHYWPGLIDITRDLLPIADADPRNADVQYVLGCAGLPWAAWCGDFVARRTMDLPTEDYRPFFGFDRQPFVPERLQSLIGKPASFALDYLHTKYGPGA